MLLLSIRGETIKYATIKKKKETEIESNLQKEIELLEESCNALNVTLLEEKKTELLNIREGRMQGHQERSRVQWLKEGEKPRKYFCSLEHQNYVEKTITRGECP